MDSSLVYLVQTDTTVGFSSLNDEKLSTIKQRPTSKKILHTVDSFKTLNEHTRVPKKFRKKVRNSKKTTFIYPNTKSFRVVDKNSDFYDFIHKFGILYSTSANKTGENFDKDFFIALTISLLAAIFIVIYLIHPFNINVNLLSI